MALNLVYYNFCNRYIAIRTPPAKAAEVADHEWTVAELVEPVAGKHDYIGQVKAAVQHLHNCGAHWLRTVPAHEVFKGKTVWIGDVEVFGLVGHTKAKHAYAWAHLDGKNDEITRFVAVLEIPPVKNAKTAVQVAIVANAKIARPED